jgi:hypothetical protein
VGRRSAIFKVILLGWTAFMLLVTLGLMVAFAGSTESQRHSPYESERSGAAGAFVLGGLCCPIGIYLLLAIPQGLSAVATLESRRAKTR